MAVTQSPITWFGGKGKFAERIIEHFPQKHTTYVEPFGGSAAVLLAKNPSPVEIYNDLDGDLVNLFRAIRDPELSEQLFNALDATLYARAEFELAMQHSSDPVEAARRFLVRQRQSHGGVGKRWSYCINDTAAGMASVVRRRHAGVERLPDVRSRLKSVQIEKSDWREIFDKFDTRDTLFYLDPPYVAETRVSGGYRHELSDEDHLDLLDRIHSALGFVVLSGYENKLYKRLLKMRWGKVEFETPAQTSRTRSKRTEVLWLCPRTMDALAAERQQLSLFGAQC